MTDVLMKKGTFGHRERMPCEDEGRDEGEACKSLKETSKIASKSLEASREA